MLDRSSDIHILLDIFYSGSYPYGMSKLPKRQGTAFWFPDSEADLLRAVAAAEDRTIQAVLSRALRAYAEVSPDYQATRTKPSPGHSP